MKLSELLKIDEPCGGIGKCGKCRIRVKGELSPPTLTEERILGELLKDGWRLTCQTEVTGDYKIVTDSNLDVTDIDTEGENISNNVTDSKHGELAVDIGTTTIEVRFISENGVCERSALNPQRRFGADVISRLGAAGEHMNELVSEVRECIARLTEGFDYERAVVCGNTTMLHFVTGLDVSGMLCDPFEPSSLFGYEVDGREIGMRGRVYLPRCVSAFIGADTTSAMLAAGMVGDASDDVLLVDLGTNGELVYSRGGRLICASTAAGPALEGADISCGMRAVAGAIDRVDFDGKAIIPRVIGGGAAVGLCGSGLISAVDALLRAGVIDTSGYLSERFELAAGVFLEPADVRAFQLAKGAIATGIELICGGEKPKRLLVAGNFGRGIDLAACVRTGLLSFCGDVRIIGNAALRGAELILSGACEPREAVLCELADNERFDEVFCEKLMFPEATRD